MGYDPKIYQFKNSFVHFDKSRTLGEVFDSYPYFDEVEYAIDNSGIFKEVTYSINVNGQFNKKFVSKINTKNKLIRQNLLTEKKPGRKLLAMTISLEFVYLKGYEYYLPGRFSIIGYEKNGNRLTGIIDVITLDLLRAIYKGDFPEIVEWK